MNITIKTIPHNRQRYNTVGDWWFDADNSLQIRVSNMHNLQFETLVARHELDEAMLCAARGIRENSVTQFDLQFEQETKDKKLEPGDDPRAPYHDEHVAATKAERVYAKELGVNWRAYEKAIYDL